MQLRSNVPHYRRETLQIGLRGRKTRETSGHYELREQEAVYNAHFDHENVRLSTENAYYWDLTTEQSNR